MSEKTLGFAIVGCGVIGHKHAEEISHIADARLIAVADILPDRAREIAVQRNCADFVDYHNMVELPEVDIVTVCTPSGLHAEVAVAAARAGKHVIVEKPIDVNLEKANWMIEECKKAGVKLTVISQHRFDASTVRVKQDIEAGKLGRMILGEAAVNWFRSQGYYDSGEWRGTWALDGGGALMNQSIHTIDLLQYLMGPVEEIHAYADRLNHERIEVEDAAVAIVKFQNGGLGTIVGTTAAYPGLTARVEVFGTRGSAVIDADMLTHLYHQEVPVEGMKYSVKAENLATTAKAAITGAADPAALSSAHRLQFLDMMDAVRNHREPAVTGEEGRKPLEIILAIYTSARTGKRVTLPLTDEEALT